MGNFKKILAPLFLIILPLILTLIWFHKGLLFAGGEESLFGYNPEKTYHLYSSIWYEADSGFSTSVNIPRTVYFYLADKLFLLGLSAVQIQALTFFFLMSAGCLGIYYLLQEIVTKNVEIKNGNLIPVLGALFYLLNPYSMNQIWGRGLSFQFFAFAFIPLFLLFFALGLLKKNILFGSVAIIFSFILSAVYAHPGYVITSWADIIIFLLAYIFINKKNPKTISFALGYFIVFSGLWVLVNAFWLMPLLNQGGQLLETSTITDPVATLEGVSTHTPLPTVLRLVHNGSFFIDKIYGDRYNNLYFQLISWLIPLAALFSIKRFKKVPYFIFFSSLFLIALFLSIGSNFPTGWLLEFIFRKLPLIQAIRNPYEKFGINLLIAYIPFFTIGTLLLSEKLAKITRVRYGIFVGVFFSLICILYVWPFWQGKFAGGNIFNPWVKVPDYYQEASNWLNEQPGDFRLLQLPLIPGDGIKYNWENSFQGIEPSEFLFTRSSVAKDNYFNKEYYVALGEKFGRTGAGVYELHKNSDNRDFKDDSLVKELNKLNIKYLVVHNDIDWQFSGSVSPEDTEKYLDKQMGIHKVRSFGSLDIYIADISPSISLIYSSQVTVTYQKKDSMNYLVQINDADKAFTLNFLEHFDPAWEAYIQGNKINDHFKIFSYANAWNIDQKGTYNIEIKFKGQESLTSGFRITKISLGLVSAVTLLSLLWSVRRKILGN